MRIKEISITDLFGVFNHVIPLNLEDRITIIYGKNGVGKTTLLKLINGIFHSQLDYIVNIDFEEFIIKFEDNVYANIDRKLKKTYLYSFVDEYQLEYDLDDIIKVRLIEHDRLLNLAANNLSEKHNHQSLLHSVANYAQELAQNIQAKLTEYGTLSQSLDRTFPARVVQQKKIPELTDESLRHKLNELEEKRYKLIEAGLLNRDEDPNFQIQGDIDESTKKILSVYIEDVDKKLSVFNEIARKTDLIKRIINDKFYYKQINISKDTGFTFTTDDGKSLSPTNLSSGEQHELVLLYELLFKVEPNSLILIDEPELSLHVEWQVQFLKDLQEITKLSNIDVLIATHSPDIIHDRWDLTVELKGPAE